MKQAMLISPQGTTGPHTHTSKVFITTTLYYRLAVLQDIPTGPRKCYQAPIQDLIQGKIYHISIGYEKTFSSITNFQIRISGPLLILSY